MIIACPARWRGAFAVPVSANVIVDSALAASANVAIASTGVAAIVCVAVAILHQCDFDESAQVSQGAATTA